MCMRTEEQQVVTIPLEAREIFWIREVVTPRLFNLLIDGIWKSEHVRFSKALLMMIYVCTTAVCLLRLFIQSLNELLYLSATVKSSPTLR